MSDWLPSLNALRAFEATSRHLSYRKAAKELNVTPAAVMQLVRKLEDTLGAQLVMRRGRGIALTEAGQTGRDGLQTGFGQIADAVGKMRAAEQRKSLVVSIEPSFATLWLVPRLDRFRADNPGINVLIDSTLAIVDLENGAADVALRYGVEDSPGQVKHRLYDDRICAFCSPSVGAALPARPKLEELRRLTLIHWDLSGVNWAAATKRWMEWSRWLQHVGTGHIPSDEGLHFSDYNQATQAAIAGQGVVLGSWPILRRLVDENLLAAPFEQAAVTDIGYDLVTTKSALKRDEVKRFVDWILTEARG